MKFFYDKQANKPGIYKIINTHNGRVYIGQASQFKERWFAHKSGLLTGKRQNQFLLNDFRKCFKLLGHDDFLEFHVLEALPKSTKAERNIREEFYIKQYYDKQDKCYNFKQKSDAMPRSVFSKEPDITKKLLSQKSKAMWADPKHRAKLKKIHSDPEWIKNQSEKQKKVSQDPNNGNSGAAHRKKYSNPKEREKLSKKLKEAWVRDDGSRRKKASKRAKEIYEANKEKIAKARLKAKAKYYGKVVSPEGNVFEIYNAQAFIREHAFSQMFYELLNGKYESYKGWKRVE